MKILQIRFKNLNSLVGEWQIDLTDPAYTSDGIFAITGPTGAGKSTILDAICLALYGRTPRLHRVSKSGNEIMSRQTGECFAEVTFETAVGCYRCHWSQRRARKKADGELQAPQQEIANAVTGEVLESLIRRVADQVETVTGMDFERFTRSMLLAQGGFAAFLQAAPDERAPILEQITGTEIYSDISIRVHERQRAEKQQLDLLQAETAGITLLDQQQEQQINQALEARLKEDATLSEHLAGIQQAITWLTGIDVLNREITALEEEAARLSVTSTAFQPEQARLNLALNAAALDGSYATLSTTRKQLQQDRTVLAAAQQALPALESAAQQQAQMLDSAEQHCALSRQALTDAAPTLQKVRSLDQTLADQARIIKTEQQACEAAASDIDAIRQQQKVERQKQAAAGRQLQQVLDYLQQNARDEWLISGLAGVKEQIQGLIDRQREIEQRQSELRGAEQNLKQAGVGLENVRQQYSQQKRGLEETTYNTQRAREALNQLLQGRLLREYRAEKDNLLREAALLSRIAALEEQRNRLAAGQPCPLCGATEHPFARGNVPTPAAAERRIAELDKLIAQADEQEVRIRALEQAELQAHTAFANTEAAGKAARHELETAETRLTEMKAAVQALQDDFSVRRHTVSASLLHLGISEISDHAIASLLEGLEARLKAWQTHVASQQQIDKQIADLTSEIRRLDAIMESNNSALASRRERLTALQKEQADKAAQRKEVFGEHDPNTEERRLQDAINAAVELEKQARARHSELHQQWSNTRVHSEALQQRVVQYEPELTRLEAAFAEQLHSVGFTDEQQYLAAVLPATERAKLAARARELEQQQTDLNAKRKDRQSRLAAEMERKITDQTLEQLQPQLSTHQQALKELREVTAGLRHQLLANTAARERVRAKQAAIEAQQTECRRWDALHALIGSADGKKYRNFAQGLTFEMMVGHANRQLQKMTDRYLLVRDNTQPLELNVMDNYQAGEVRSTKNLSGGESFIVSLALALGLSHMSSRNVRVDSLFLDEGFGTLDEEALDTALDTLAGLQQEGKLIGIISHVQALKERISTRIVVQPQTGGRSRITGPGCVQL